MENETTTTERWDKLSPEMQRYITARMLAQPVLCNASLWRKIVWAPRVFWRQYQAGTLIFPPAAALRHAFPWTYFFLFGANKGTMYFKAHTK